MKFGKNKKGKKGKSPSPSYGLPVSLEQGMSNKEALKRLKEMEKRKAKPTPCPYIKDCDFKMLPQVGRIFCLDQEDGRQSQAYMIHMAGHHVWMQCKKYVERMREEQGVLPRDLPKALKELAKKAKAK